MDSVVGRRPRLVLLAACLSLAILAPLAFGPASRSASAAGVSVEAGNDYFCSQTFEGSVCETDITVGDMLTWNVVAGSHTVTECSAGFVVCPPAGGFDSGILVDGQTFVHTFDAPGTYVYRCELHTSEMLGKIVVSAATTSPTIAPTPTTATESPTTAPTIAALPRTGGAPIESGATTRLYALAAAGIAWLSAALVVFSAADEVIR